MNYIEKVRSETLRYFNPDNVIVDSEEIFLAPNNKYRAETRCYIQEKYGEATKVDVYENSDLLFSFLVNEGTFFHSWVTQSDTDYLLCAEDLFGGQTVIDLTNRKMASYSPDVDGFIWTKHLLSPNGKLLAVFGCGWGSPYFVIVYHFDNPMELPLKIACEPDWTGYDIIEWVDNNNLKVMDTVDRERILEI